MTIINVLCVATEKESADCKSQYITFTRTLQSKSSQFGSIKILDVRGVNKQGSGKLTDKLKDKTDTCPVIIVVCSPNLKEYLDNGKIDGSEFLKKDEREVLLKGLVKNKGKVIPVFLDEKHKGEVPNILKDVEVVDGVGGMSDLVDVKIPPLVTK